MRAKFLVTEVTQNENSNKVVVQETVKFRAVAKTEGYPEDGSDEDNTFARFTPNAELSVSINNPALFGQFHVGGKWYADFSPADQAAVSDKRYESAPLPPGAGDNGSNVEDVRVNEEPKNSL